VALALLLVLEDYARAQGFQTLKLSTLESMKPACRFYERNGFTLAKRMDLGEVKRYDMPSGIDAAVFFAKPL
jgi:GNAT superfamily N-acetyltransferase